ncbi:MAG: ABC transporter permease, partial [Anaerolineae bacterium]
MNGYLSLVPRYLSVHAKRTRLVVLGVAISVALITGVFSMLEFLQRMSVVEQIHTYGHYHLSVANATAEEQALIAARLDVANTGVWRAFRQGTLNGRPSRIDALEEGFAPEMQIAVSAGQYPRAADEMMLEEWAASDLGLAIGDR